MNKELIAAELESLKREDGTLEAQDVVDFAKNHPKSEAHKHFNWNVAEAANAYWLQQARYLITICVVISSDPSEKGEEIRAWFREGKPDDPEQERANGYVPTEDMLKDPNQRRKVIVTTIKRCLGILGSYPLPELKPLITLAKKLLRKYQQSCE